MNIYETKLDKIEKAINYLDKPYNLDYERVFNLAKILVALKIDYKLFGGSDMLLNRFRELELRLSILLEPF